MVRQGGAGEKIWIHSIVPAVRVSLPDTPDVLQVTNLEMPKLIEATKGVRPSPPSVGW